MLDEDAPLHTELGVLSDANGVGDGPAADSSRHSPRQYAAGTESPGSVDRNFSLGDLEDEEDDQHMLKNQPNSSVPKQQPPQQPQGSAPTRQALQSAGSQSSSPRARGDGSSTPRGEPARPKKPSGKKD